MRSFLAVLAAASFSNAAQAADVVKIAITGPFSGGSAPMGVSMRDGAKLAFSQINERGGILVGGKKMKVEVIERDDEGKNDIGELVAREISSMNDVSAVIGTVNTGIAVMGDKYYVQKGIVKIITPAAGSASMTQWSKAGATDLPIFRFAAHDGIQSRMVVEQAIRLGVRKVAIFHDDTNYGISGRDDLLSQIRNKPGKLDVVDIEQFAIGDREMTGQLIKAKIAGAQAILIWGIGPELAAVASGKKKLSYNVPMIGGWTLSMSNFIDTAGPAGNGALMPQTFIEDLSISRAKPFIRAYRQTYRVTRIPSPVSAAQGYDAALLLAEAIHEAGSTQPSKIKAALEDLSAVVRGAIADWKKPWSKWNPTNGESHEAFRRTSTVMGKVQDGRVVLANSADRAVLERNPGK
ncbi:MAG: ABC transporter substrate-binding protein [Chlorobiaceae bacterium]|nr:ABC transporter substrate-binding protein [Chlorobiaceae bacterium]NTW10627.1 ABC transporter substrate-binding protein [Chlorobiaceae bacterium]